MDTTTAEVDSPQTEETSIEDASTNDLREALGLTEAAPEGAAPESEAEAPETTETPQEPEAEGQEPEVESEEERLAKRRIRPRNELDQQVIDLYRSDGFSGSFADASRIIFGQQEQSTNLPPQAVEAPQPDPYDGQVGELQGQITALEEQVAKAAEDLETTEALKLQREIMRKELQLQSMHDRRERQTEAQQQQAYQTHRTKAMESRDKVYERIPELQNRESVTRKQFDSPKWPELLAGEFFSNNPQPQPQQQQQVQQPQQQQVPQMGTQAKVLTTGTTAQPVNAPVTTEGLLANLPNVSNEDLYKMLGDAGGPKPLR